MKALIVLHETYDQETLLRQGAKHAKFRREKINYLEKIVYYYFPIFAALASLREIFRVSVMTLPLQNTHHGYTPDKLPTV
jgi:hypothetical protein